jgi:pimeloyl-ACP methyl ester carboxylesterase
MHAAPRTTPNQWAGLAGREHGERTGSGRPFVFLHGLTFDHRMWDPVLEFLPGNHRVIAFDLPGHGESPQVADSGLAPVVEAIHEAVQEAGLVKPIVVGHSIGGPLAAIYAATYPAAAVVSIEAPIRFEPFAAMLASLRPQLTDDRFPEAWAMFEQGLQIDAVPAAHRGLVQMPGPASRDVFVSYQADLLERPLDEVVRWRENGMEQLRRLRVPYITLHANGVEKDERDWLLERLPQAEIVVWPVGHHFPHLADPSRFAALVTGLAAGAAA